jgi:hypothetical protein
MKKKNDVRITQQGPVTEIEDSFLPFDAPRQEEQELSSLREFNRKLALQQNSTEGFEYTSSSTIDTPPEVKEETREPVNQLYRGERIFAVNLTLRLTPKGGQTVTIPVFCDDTRGTMVEEMLELAMRDPRTRGIILSVLDNPKDRVAGEAAEEEKQGKLFGDL